MIWELSWSFVARNRDIKEVRWRAAERIDAALIRLAKTGRGSLSRIEPNDPNRFRLRVDGAEAQLLVDRRSRTIYVVRVYPHS